MTVSLRQEGVCERLGLQYGGCGETPGIWILWLEFNCIHSIHGPSFIKSINRGRLSNEKFFAQR